MILVEADDDLAGCVEGFFSTRYDVCRVPTLRDAVEVLKGKEAGVLFADISLGSSDESSIVEKLHKDHPNMRIVLTYLTPSAGESREARLRGSADLLVRKPYSVLEVFEAMRASGGGCEEQT